jgi:hypothetical protein
MTSEELAREITEVILDAQVDAETAFRALQGAIMFRMSCLCIDCRRNVARKLKANIPKMVEGADQTAEYFDQIPICH